MPNALFDALIKVVDDEIAKCDAEIAKMKGTPLEELRPPTTSI